MNASYMEMVIKDDDLRGLKMVYKLHKQGISREHPQFGFRKPMRLAAEYGRLDMLKWLGEQEERGEWLEDRWLLDAAIKSCSLDVVQWVHSVYTGKDQFVLLCKPLDLVAPQGALELLQWVLATFPKAQLTTNAMDGAAANCHLEMVKYLHSEWKEGFSTCSSERRMHGASDEQGGLHGHLEVVMFLHEHREEGCTTQAMDHAAKHGHLEVVQSLHTSRSEGCTETVMEEALRYGHVDVMEYLHKRLCCQCNWLSWVTAALIDRSLSAVKYVCEYFNSDVSAESLEYAKAEDLFEMIQLFEQYNVDGWTTILMDHAAAVGCLESVRYLHSHRTEACTTRAMDEAAQGGHLDVVKFLHENRSEGCTKRAMNDAAANGALDVVKYLHAHRKEGCTRRAIDEAALNGHNEVVKLLLDHFVLEVSNDAITNAAKNGHRSVLELLLQKIFPEDLTLLLRAAAAGGHVALLKYFSNFVDAIPVDLIEEAVCNGHWYITKFLLSTTDQLDAMSDRSFSKTVEIASLYGDIDMVELLLSANYRFKPSNAHGFINTSILGNIDLLELLEKARQQGGDLWERLIYDDMDTEPFAGTKMKWRSVQLAVTAYYGHVELAHWLYDRRYGHFKSAHLAQRAASDEVDMARTILSFEPSAQVNNDDIAAAAKRGNVRLFKLLYQFWEVKESRRPLIDYAVGGGSYDLVKFIHENCPKAVCTWRAIDLAVRSDQLDIVRYLHEKRTEGCLVNAMGIAACKYYLTTLQFLHTHRHEGCTTAAMDWAAAHGNLSVVKFLPHENRSEGCTSAAMDEAAEREYFHVVQYLHTNRTEGCTTSAMDSVARHGSFRVLNWLHENRDEGCSTKAMDGAALTSQLTIVKFLHEHRTEGCTKRALDAAIRRCDLDMVKFLHKNRQEGYHEAVLDKAVQLDPEDESLVQQYLRPVELKDYYASSLFTSA